MDVSQIIEAVAHNRTIQTATFRTSMDPARRLFLRGKISVESSAPIPRPPWVAGNEKNFTEMCTRCNACIEICPTQIIFAGDAGYPEVRFTANGCNECGKCVEACQPKALNITPQRLPWRWKVMIDSNCLAQKNVECRICGETCDHSAIRFRPVLGGIALPELSKAVCTGCGHCVATCPTQAMNMSEAQDQA